MRRPRRPAAAAGERGLYWPRAPSPDLDRPGRRRSRARDLRDRRRHGCGAANPDAPVEPRRTCDRAAVLRAELAHDPQLPRRRRTSGGRRDRAPRGRVLVVVEGRVDRGHDPRRRQLRRSDRPAPRGRRRRAARRRGQPGAADQRRRRTQRAPDAGADRHVHDPPRARPPGLAARRHGLRPAPLALDPLALPRPQPLPRQRRPARRARGAVAQPRSSSPSCASAGSLSSRAPTSSGCSTAKCSTSTASRPSASRTPTPQRPTASATA